MVLALFTLEQYQGRRHENVRDLKQSGLSAVCLSTHTAPHLNFSITYKRRVEFQMEIKIIYLPVSVRRRRKLWLLHVVVLHGMAKKCTKF